MSSSAERRATPERRSVERRKGLALVGEDRRSTTDRRQGGDRRANEAPQDLLRSALQLLTRVADEGGLDDELQRNLDSAIFRIRFAVERLERAAPTRET